MNNLIVGTRYTLLSVMNHVIGTLRVTNAVVGSAEHLA
jgi:hypothetical protein